MPQILYELLYANAFLGLSVGILDLRNKKVPAEMVN